MNKTPQKIIVSLYDDKGFGIPVSSAEIVYSHSEQEFIVFGNKRQQQKLDELIYYLREVLPKQTLIPGNVDSEPYRAQPGEKLLRVVHIFGSSVGLRPTINCRIGDGYCLTEISKDSLFPREEYRDFIANLSDLKDTPVIYKSDLRASSSRWSEVTLLAGDKANILTRCVTKSGFDLITVSYHEDLLLISEKLKAVEANYNRACYQKFPLSSDSGLVYQFAKIEWLRHEKRSYQTVRHGKGHLYTTDGKWLVDVQHPDFLNQLTSLIPGLSKTHLFHRHYLDLESIGESRYD